MLYASVARVGVGGALAHITLNMRFTTIAINVERKERSPNIPRLALMRLEQRTYVSVKVIAPAELKLD